MKKKPVLKIKKRGDEYRFKARLWRFYEALGRDRRSNNKRGIQLNAQAKNSIN